MGRAAVMYSLLHGDCVEVMRDLPDHSIDSIVCDPPYGLEFMGKGWDSMGHGNAQQAWHVRWLAEALRVLKPGGYLLAFGGTRTAHRLVCAAEDVGFEIRDTLQWLYGQGFPKSLNVSKAIDKAAGAERGVVATRKTNVDTNGSTTGEVDITAPATADAQKWDGWGTALKPAYEPILLARKPLSEKTVAANVLEHGTSAINIDGCRIATSDNVSNHSRGDESATSKGAFGDSVAQETHQTSGQALGRYPANILLSHTPDCVEVGTTEIGKGLPTVSSGGKSGDSAWEHRGGSYKAGATNTGVRDYGAETVPVFQCAPGCPVAMLDEQSGPAGQMGAMVAQTRPSPHHGVFSPMPAKSAAPLRDDPTTGASRFFYTSKANNSERWGYCHACGTAFCRGIKADRAKHAKCPAPEGRKNAVEWHPTVKPVDIMRWLVRLVTPPGGVVLDPFAGTGTTGEAAIAEGFHPVLIEQSAVYFRIIARRLATGASRQDRV